VSSSSLSISTESKREREETGVVDADADAPYFGNEWAFLNCIFLSFIFSEAHLVFVRLFNPPRPFTIFTIFILFEFAFFVP